MVKRISLYLRLYPSYLLILLAGVALVAIPSGWFLAHDHEIQVQRQLELQADLVRKMIPDQEMLWKYQDFDALFRDASFRLTIIKADGVVFYDNRKPAELMENHLLRPEVQNLLAGKIPSSKRFSHTLGLHMLYFVKKGPQGSFIRLANPLDAIYSTISGYLLKIFAVAFAVAVFAGFVSFYTGRRLTRPLKVLEEKADMLGRIFLDQKELDLQKLDQSIPKTPPFRSKEFQQLSDTMDHMARQLIKEVERQQEQYDRHQVLLKSMEEGVLSVDMNHQVLSYNQAAIELFNLPPDRDLLGLDVRLHLRHPVLLDAIRDVLTNGKQKVNDLQAYNPKPRFLEVKSVPLRGFEGEHVGAVLVGQDLTGIRSVAKMRKDFVANVSHELKTPITAIKGFVETLLTEGPFEADQQNQFLTIIQKHTDRMVAIIDDLLALSNLEGKREDVELGQVDLKTVIEDALLSCRKKAEKKSITLELNSDFADGIPGNANLLEQALVNLLDNAIKYSPEGTTVWVRVQKEGNECILHVKDEGMGIPLKYHDRLFERFFRVDKARSKKEGGTGLGLAIVKHIVALHGGYVGVESKKGHGSQFTLRLPLTRTQSQS